MFSGHPDLDLDGDYGQFGWFDDTTRVLESPIFAGDFDDVALMMMREDEDGDESVFSDLGELPECSVVFRRGNIPGGSVIRCGGITG